MHPINENTVPRNIERKLHATNQTLNHLVAQTPEEVREMEAMFGSTPSELPVGLRDASQVLERIVREDDSSQSPSAFGKLVTLLRTKQKITLQQLADKTDLDIDELEEIETCADSIPEPMAVSVLAEFFRLAPKKLQGLAGLTRESSGLGESLGIAACAKPEFDQLNKHDRKLFNQWVKQLRK